MLFAYMHDLFTVCKQFVEMQINFEEILMTRTTIVLSY